MTFRDLLQALVRRWPIVLVGVLVTAACAFLVTRQDGIYFSRTQAVFLAPSSKVYPNSLKTQSEDLIITAGLVAKRINGAAEPLKYGSPDVSLIGIPPTGQDYWIRLPDTGGQWAPNFPYQVLLIDVVGATAQQVRDTVKKVDTRISDELDALQRGQRVASVNDITVTFAPESGVVQYIHPSKTRAMGMTAVIGALLTIAAVIVLELRRAAPGGGARRDRRWRATAFVARERLEPPQGLTDAERR